MSWVSNNGHEDGPNEKKEEDVIEEEDYNPSGSCPGAEIERE